MLSTELFFFAVFVKENEGLFCNNFLYTDRHRNSWFSAPNQNLLMKLEETGKECDRVWTEFQLNKYILFDIQRFKYDKLYYEFL